jgi:hypothetical protein
MLAVMPRAQLEPLELAQLAMGIEQAQAWPPLAGGEGGDCSSLCSPLTEPAAGSMAACLADKACNLDDVSLTAIRLQVCRGLPPRWRWRAVPGRCVARPPARLPVPLAVAPPPLTTARCHLGSDYHEQGIPAAAASGGERAGCSQGSSCQSTPG